MHRFTRKHQWQILVWIILGLFIFPLTPPISHHFTNDTEVLVLANTTQVLTIQEPTPTKKTIYTLIDDLHSYNDFFADYETTVFVIFIVFILSKIWLRLKAILLSFLKFSSGYTGLIYHYS
ncbi:hypothetical protein ACFPES_13365 [Paenibacillus sp. GCM10023248]|uniref:hypothetical protein n=1 Tax=Bacillales TaxID=1385 RepID=UPI002377EEA4|nr:MULTISPECIES: hypothetical protein [Bacillales]MDD9268021.1 hypothetical protein [Paenibacillus sp. MAHUQ-63]MDR6879694.1 hypothetical protein [Bacillus sp. 3255]